MSQRTFHRGDKVVARNLIAVGSDGRIPEGTLGEVVEVDYTHSGTRVVTVLFEDREFAFGFGPGAVEALQ